MIVHDLEQGTGEWLRARLGIPTTSDFDKIISPDGKLMGETRRTFAKRNLTELMLGRPVETPNTEWMIRGSDLEREAVETYEFMTDLKTETVGFITDDKGLCGTSPDRMVGEDGLLEIKCPAPWTHTEYLIENKIDKKYKPQMQGQMFITGRKWVDWYSYHPELAPLVIRHERDEKYQERIRYCLDQYNEYMKLKISELKSRGYEFKMELNL